jgi:hypothetical protein
MGEVNVMHVGNTTAQQIYRIIKPERERWMIKERR